MKTKTFFRTRSYFNMPRYQVLNTIVQELEQFEKTTNLTNFSVADFVAHLAGHPEFGFRSDKTKGSESESLERDYNISGIDLTIAQFIFYMTRYAKLYSKRILKDTPIKSLEEFGYLATLISFNQLTKIDLIQRNVHEKPTGMDIIKRLMKSGLISQEQNPDDQRSQVVSITPLGREITLGLFREMDKLTRVVTGPLSPIEKAQLAHYLKKLDDFHNFNITNRKTAELEDLIP